MSKSDNKDAPIAGIVARSWMHNVGIAAGERLVSAHELVSLNALIAYAAHKSGASEFSVERTVADLFNVPNITCLPTGAFDAAIRHLVYTVMGETDALA